MRSAESDEVEECKNEDPNEVYEVPVETNFLHHFIVLSAFEYAAVGHEENDDVDDYTGEYVETVKPRDEEKEVCIRLLDGIFVVVHVCAERKGFRARIPQFHRFIAAYVRFIFDVFVDRERVELGFMRVLSILHKLDAVVAVLQCHHGVALEPRLSEVAEMMVHVDCVSFVQVERLAIVGADRHVFSEQVSTSAAVDKVRPLPGLRSQKEEPTNDGQAQPFDNPALVVAVSGLNGQHHGVTDDTIKMKVIRAT